MCAGAQVARDAFGSALSGERLVIRSQTWALTRDGLGVRLVTRGSGKCSRLTLEPEMKWMIMQLLSVQRSLGSSIFRCDVLKGCPTDCGACMHVWRS